MHPDEMKSFLVLIHSYIIGLRSERVSCILSHQHTRKAPYPVSRTLHFVPLLGFHGFSSSLGAVYWSDPFTVTKLWVSQRRCAVLWTTLTYTPIPHHHHHEPHAPRNHTPEPERCAYGWEKLNMRQRHRCQYMHPVCR